MENTNNNNKNPVLTGDYQKAFDELWPCPYCNRLFEACECLPDKQVILKLRELKRCVEYYKQIVVMPNNEGKKLLLSEYANQIKQLKKEVM